MHVGERGAVPRLGRAHGEPTNICGRQAGGCLQRAPSRRRHRKGGGREIHLLHVHLGRWQIPLGEGREVPDAQGPERALQGRSVLGERKVVAHRDVRLPVAEGQGEVLPKEAGQGDHVKAFHNDLAPGRDGSQARCSLPCQVFVLKGTGVEFKAPILTGEGAEIPEAEAQGPEDLVRFSGQPVVGE